MFRFSFEKHRTNADILLDKSTEFHRIFSLSTVFCFLRRPLTSHTAVILKVLKPFLTLINNNSLLFLTEFFPFKFWLRNIAELAYPYTRD